MTYNEVLKTIAGALGTTHEYYDFITTTLAQVSFFFLAYAHDR